MPPALHHTRATLGAVASAMPTPDRERPLSQVENSLRLNQDLRGNLHEKICELHRRLAPVLVSTPDKNEKDPGTPPTGIPLVDTVEEGNAQLSHLNRLCADLLERLAI